MNKFQEALCKTYGGGDYAYMVEPSNRGNWFELSTICGDTLFTFLMRELADVGDEIMTRDEAARRLEVARDDIAKALWGLDRSYPNE